MNKILLIGLLVLIILAGGFFAFNQYIYNEKQGDSVSTQELASYFADEVFERGVADGVIPVEGFDAGLLLGEFPGLTPEDFDNVETFEGIYSIEEGDVIYTRTVNQPVTSAERTVSKEGYATLLENLSRRLEFPVYNKENIDELLNMLETPSGTYETHTDEEVGLSFSYRVEPNGYRLDLVEFDAAPSLGDPGFVKGYRLMLKSDYLELQKADEPREGPPTINILIFENDDNETASAWVDNNDSFSNTVLLVGEIERNVILAGADAVFYTYDGLYTNDAVVAVHDGYVYMLSGSYFDPNQMIRKDFQTLLDSVEFTSPQSE